MEQTRFTKLLVSARAVGFSLDLMLYFQLEVQSRWVLIGLLSQFLHSIAILEAQQAHIPRSHPVPSKLSLIHRNIQRQQLRGAQHRIRLHVHLKTGDREDMMVACNPVHPRILLAFPGFFSYWWSTVLSPPCMQDKDRCECYTVGKGRNALPLPHVSNPLLNRPVAGGPRPLREL